MINATCGGLTAKDTAVSVSVAALVRRHPYVSRVLLFLFFVIGKKTSKGLMYQKSRSSACSDMAGPRVSSNSHWVPFSCLTQPIIQWEPLNTLGGRYKMARISGERSRSLLPLHSLGALRVRADHRGFRPSAAAQRDARARAARLGRRADCVSRAERANPSRSDNKEGFHYEASIFRQGEILKVIA